MVGQTLGDLIRVQRTLTRIDRNKRKKLGEFSKVVRQGTVHCPEIKHNILVTFWPEGTDQRKMLHRDIVIPGLKEPVRIWLRALSREADSIRAFIRKFLHRDLKSKVKAVRVWEAWSKFVREDPHWWGINMSKVKFYQELQNYLGKPAYGSYRGWRMS